MFDSIIQSYTFGSATAPDIIILSENNIYNCTGIPTLIKTCHEHVSYSTLNEAHYPISLWLNDFLEKYFDYIPYIAGMPMFESCSIENNQIVYKSNKCDTFKLKEEDLDLLFKDPDKAIALYSIRKVIDLTNHDVHYIVRACNLMTTQQIRDRKLCDVLK